jgi:ADP-ribose pyrophosphatase YjhB (NUDIX family)
VNQPPRDAAPRAAGTGDPVLAAALAALPPGLPLTTPSPATAEFLRAAGREIVVAALEDLADDGAEALVLIDDELSAQTGDAEALLAEAGRAVHPGGLVAVSALGAVAPQSPPESPRGRPFRAEDLRRLLSQRGLDVRFLAAPGAGARVRRDDADRYDPDVDRLPGLLDAGARLVAVARAPRSASERSATFFAGLPRKVVAAAVLARDERERLLLVFDSFKRHWTIPGGVVDADEDPRSAAAREAEEETGLRVEVGALLGVFAASFPDRLVFVYAATPCDLGAAPTPRHPHEIGEAAWLELSEARARLAAVPREQVERCLTAPGGTWRQEAAEPGY